VSGKPPKKKPDGDKERGRGGGRGLLGASEGAVGGSAAAHRRLQQTGAYGFAGDPTRPVAGRYYGFMAAAGGF
jgi:hypothetical protein